MTMEKLLLRNIGVPASHTLATYQSRGGYASWRKVVENMKPEQLIEEVKASGLRGRGGAGFPTGMKWSFVPKDNPKPKYLVCNADESEPGTFKDRLLIEQDPHAIIEGTLIAAFAIQSHTAFIYIRGELVAGGESLVGPPGGAAVDHRGRRGRLCGHGHGEKQGDEALQRQRPYFPARRLRGGDGLSVQEVSRRGLRRRAQRQKTKRSHSRPG